jgi:hypothetical protein
MFVYDLYVCFVPIVIQKLEVGIQNYEMLIQKLEIIIQKVKKVSCALKNLHPGAHHKNN